MLRYAIDLNKYKERDPRPGKDNYHEEYQYLNLLKDLMEHGTLEEGRNGKTKIGNWLLLCSFSLENGKIPVFLLLKKLLVKTWYSKNCYGLFQVQTDAKISNRPRSWNMERKYYKRIFRNTRIRL